MHPPLTFQNGLLGLKWQCPMSPYIPDRFRPRISLLDSGRPPIYLTDAAPESSQSPPNNITSAWAADREFFEIHLFLWLPLDSFGCLCSAFGAPWAHFGFLLAPLGALARPFGRPFVYSGSLWSGLGLPVDVLWGPFGRPGTFGAWLTFLKLTCDYKREGLEFDAKA
jgi:hypothetical protein